jgi:DNA modification methylase
MRLIHADCLDALRSLADDSVDSVVTDPPYGLSFMGKSWDYDVPTVEVWSECLRVLKPGGHLLAFSGSRTYHRMVVNIEDAGFEIRDQIMWVYGSGLKPAHEPIVVARKPVVGTIVENLLEYGTGALNIDGCRVGSSGATARGSQVEYPKNEDGTEDRTDWARSGHEIVALPKGRFPANFIHDGSDEVVELFPTSKSVAPTENSKDGGEFPSDNTVTLGLKRVVRTGFSDSGSSARFFYCPKVSKKERNEGLIEPNKHPTVKPVDLMRYLCRLITPPEGIVLDPFMGSGSTGVAALLEEFDFIGIEREEEYVRIAEGRIDARAEAIAEESRFNRGFSEWFSD